RGGGRRLRRLEVGGHAGLSAGGGGGRRGDGRDRGGPRRRPGAVYPAATAAVPRPGADAAVLRPCAAGGRPGRPPPGHAPRRHAPGGPPGRGGARRGPARAVGVVVRLARPRRAGDGAGTAATVPAGNDPAHAVRADRGTAAGDRLRSGSRVPYTRTR